MAEVLQMPQRLTTHGQRVRAAAGPAPESRPSPSRRGYDRRWRKVRRLALARDNHLCQDHARRGVLVEGNEVDHVVPVSRGGSRFDLGNLETLCGSCHARKTAREDGGFGRKEVPRG